MRQLVLGLFALVNGQCVQPSLRVVIAYIFNPTSIAKGKGDPRFKVLAEVARELKQRGHEVVQLPVSPKSTKDLPRSFVREFGKSVQACDRETNGWCAVPGGRKPDCLVGWYNWKASGSTWGQDVTPGVIYENGFTKDSIVVDPRGLLGDSLYVASLNARVQQGHDDAACKRHVAEHLAHDSSKRPQKSVCDFPREILGSYIFIPTQKFLDVSITKFSKVSYPELLNQTAAYCAAHGIPLVAKIHPHLEGEERASQERLLRALNASHHPRRVFESKSSINFLTQHAKYTVTLNGGTLFDNFYTATPVLTLARSLFQDTDAVVHEEGVLAGLERMARTPWDEARRLRQRQIVCWYERTSMSVQKSAGQNIAVLEGHFREGAREGHFRGAPVSLAPVSRACARPPADAASGPGGRGEGGDSATQPVGARAARAPNATSSALARYVGRAALFQRGADPTRYLSVLSVPKTWSTEAPTAREVWLVGKDGAWPSANPQDRSVMWGKCDPELKRIGTRTPCLGVGSAGAVGMRLPKEAEHWGLSHNLGMAFVRHCDAMCSSGLGAACSPKSAAVLLGIGGREHVRADIKPAPRGVSALFSLSREDANAGGWARLFSGVTGKMGCVEARAKTKYVCEFDGRMSVAVHRGRLFLYARANLHASAGGRFVQVTSVSTEALRQVLCTRNASHWRWDEWRLVDFQGSYSHVHARKSANIYFMAVNQNPADRGSLLGMFPVREGDVAYIAIALTCDGVRFSAVHPVLASGLGSEAGHSRDHPVDGFVRRGGEVLFFVHTDVPGTFTDAKGNVPDGWEASHGLQSGIAQYAMPLAALRQFTARAKLQLGASCAEV